MKQELLPGILHPEDLTQALQQAAALGTPVDLTCAPPALWHGHETVSEGMEWEWAVQHLVGTTGTSVGTWTTVVIFPSAKLALAVAQSMMTYYGQPLGRYRVLHRWRGSEGSYRCSMVCAGNKDALGMMTYTSPGAAPSIYLAQMPDDPASFEEFNTFNGTLY